MASFRFCETCLLHIKPSVVNKSAIFPFLGGMINALMKLDNGAVKSEFPWSPQQDCAFSSNNLFLYSICTKFTRDTTSSALPHLLTGRNECFFKSLNYEEWCRWTRANQRRCTPRHRSGLAHTPAGAHFSGSCSQCRETRQHACCCAVLTTAMEHACHDATHRFGTSMHGRWSPRRPIARPPPNQPRRPHLPTHPHLLTNRLTGSPVWGASLKVLRNVLPSLQSPSLEQWGMSCPRPLNSSLGHHVWIHSKASINNSTQRAFTESYWYEAPALVSMRLPGQLHCMRNWMNACVSAHCVAG